MVFPPSSTGRASLLTLFVASFATLYVEIMLIRWLGTEVRVFAYFQNLALIACFLGFGLGCYRGGKASVIASLAALAALVTAVKFPAVTWQKFLQILSNLLSLSSDYVQWGRTGSEQTEGTGVLVVISVLTIVLFLGLLMMVMVPLGQIVGSCLDASSNVVSAYSVNLLGSLVGIWAFAFLSMLWLPPWVWLGAAFLTLFALMRQRSTASVVLSVGIAVLVLLLTWERDPGTLTYWSPYQKLELKPLEDSQYSISVNNTGYMSIANTTASFLGSHPEIAGSYRTHSSYDLPFRFALRPTRVLIVGAGAGNDSAAALRNGATDVDAVEIDPVVLHLGERYHPDRPYSSPAVNKVLTDARAFMRRAREPYDVIIFGLLDSHTHFSDLTNMRIDNYVYTAEAFAEAKRLLKPDGLLVVKFEVRHPWTWIGQRLDGMLQQTFGRAPLVTFVPQLGRMSTATVFLTSTDPDLWQRAQRPELQALISPPPFTRGGDPIRATTDDWPYIYLRETSIPSSVLTISVILLALAVLVTRRILRLSDSGTWQFFFLGAGFLLMETQLISRLALYFGTTWIVNCVAITGILIVLVLANLFVQRRAIPSLQLYYGFLLASLLLNYVVPWAALPFSAQTTGILLSLAYCPPLFFAGIIFTESFRRSAARSAAFGANIVGAVAGGLAQNVSFLFGLKGLLLLASIFYAAAALFSLRRAREARVLAADSSPA